MKDNVATRILRVTSLKSFCDEVPPQRDEVPLPCEPNGHKPVVRLLNRQVEGQHSAVLLLSLQGINAAGEVIWLCEAHTISWLYGKPFGQAAESAHAGMRDLETIVRAHLEANGYEVRAGDYGLPDSIKPLAASFECAKWARISQHEWKVEAVSPIAEAHNLQVASNI